MQADQGIPVCPSSNVYSYAASIVNFVLNVISHNTYYVYVIWYEWKSVNVQSNLIARFVAYFLIFQVYL